MRREAKVKRIEEPIEITCADSYYEVMDKALRFPPGGWLIVRVKATKAPKRRAEQVCERFGAARLVMQRRRNFSYDDLDFQVLKYSNAINGDYCVKITNGTVGGWFAMEYIPGDIMARRRLDWRTYV